MGSTAKSYYWDLSLAVKPPNLSFRQPSKGFSKLGGV